MICGTLFVRETGLASQLEVRPLFTRNPLFQSGKRAWTLSTLLVLVAGFGVAGCGLETSGQPASHLPGPATTKEGVSLVWGHDVQTAALHLIEKSREYCYLDIYELSDPKILHALQAAKQRGVDVRVVLDATEKHSQQVALPQLQHEGVPVESLRIHRGISHIKMLVSENAVLIGGMNFGAQSWNNNDASVVLPRPNPTFLGVFRWDWARADRQPAPAPGYEPPLLNDRAAEQTVVQMIQRATQSISMEAFDLSDWGVLTALKEALARGVTVEILLDPTQRLNSKAAPELRARGATVRFYRPYDGELMHAKILDVDHGQTFLIGSANFSHQAYVYNHEGDIELHDVPEFDKSLQADLTLQIARGTETASHVRTTDG